MSRGKLLALFGLKWNPFSPDIPCEAIRVTDRIDRFVRRIEELAGNGGFAMITGEAGTGKSVILRLLEHRLSDIRDLSVCSLTRPQSSVADFYRELAEAFASRVTASNRWGGFKVLREKWKAKLESSLRRPVILVDEAQEMLPQVLCELRLLSSDQFDSQSLITVVLAGDGRLVDKFRHSDLIPLGSRIRTRLVLDSMTAEDLAQALHHAIDQAGNPKLMNDAAIAALAEHSFGNWRAAMNMGQELLHAAAEAEQSQIDEALFFETFDRNATGKRKRRKAAPSL